MMEIRDLIGVFAILNPIGAIPLFLSLTGSRSHAEMRRIAAKTAFAVVTILLVATWLGQRLLQLFGIGVPAFRFAGGLLVLLIAIAMFHAKSTPARHTREEDAEAESKEDIAVVPLAIPLLAGPGSISLVIVDAQKASGVGAELALSAGIVVVGVLVWLVLRLAEPIGVRLGTAGLNITTRVMGLILAAMAVQFMAIGLTALLPGLGR
ncbi:MarC family protein [Acidiferrobacter sp.]|uniref:MarC family protein n=1 Tax=Acidiferrobacter sp. TaxID=1872107 RepID=UPI002628753A|nr:MarC family protein [Acidiferrobacter sp.]